MANLWYVHEWEIILPDAIFFSYSCKITSVFLVNSVTRNMVIIVSKLIPVSTERTSYGVQKI